MDDAGWSLVSQGTNSAESPWTSITLTSAGPDLQISKVSFDDELIANKEVTATVQVFNSGERIQDAFNVSVFLVNGDTSTLIAQKAFSGLDTSEAGNMRIIVDVPEGTWKLDVVIDSDAAIAELDESNNAWSESYQSSGEGFSATILVAGGSLVAIVAGAMVLLGLRKAPKVENEVVEEVQDVAKEVPVIEEDSLQTLQLQLQVQRNEGHHQQSPSQLLPKHHLQKPLLHNLQHWTHLHLRSKLNVSLVGKICQLEASMITRQTAPSTLEMHAEDGNYLMMVSLKRLHKDVIR